MPKDDLHVIGPMNRFDAPPTDQEFEELEAFLEASEPEQGMAIDAIDGMLAAIVCGPGEVKPSDWLAAIWNHTAPEYEDKDQAARVMETLMKWYNNVATDIDAGTYHPMMAVWEMEGSKEEVEYPEDWCLGFMDGMKFHSVAWESRARNDSELMDMLQPIMNVAESTEDFAQSLLDTRVRRRVIRRISDAVIDMRDYWRQQRPPEMRGGEKPNKD